MNERRKRVELPGFVGAIAQGIKCPRCHCRDLRVYGTRKEGSRIKRYRECRRCGHGPIITYEYAAENP